MKYNLTRVQIDQHGLDESRDMIAENVTKEEAEEILRERGYGDTRAKPMSIPKDDGSWPRQYVGGWMYDRIRSQYHLTPADVPLHITPRLKVRVVKAWHNGSDREGHQETVADDESMLGAKDAIRNLEEANPQLEERMADLMPWIGGWRYDFGEYSYILQTIRPDNER